jgi:uncharacterized delta-60 repeat protein
VAVVVVVLVGLTTTMTLPAASLPAGALDPTFGIMGLTVTARDGSDTITDIALQSDGKIVAVGTRSTTQLCCAIEVSRFLTDGQLDTSFGVGGYATINFPSSFDYGYSIAVEPDDEIVVTGGFGEVDVAWLTPNGQLDPAFGFGGVNTTLVGFRGGALNTGRDVIVLPDGSVLIETSTYGDPNAVVVVRLGPDGFFDHTFGHNGIAFIYFFNRQVAPIGLALDSQQRILVGAASQSLTRVARLLPDGSLDKTYGTGGSAVSPLAFGTNLTIDRHDRVVLTGATKGSNSFAVARLTPSGSPDSTFGYKSVAAIPTGGPPEAGLAQAALIRSDDSVVVTGRNGGGALVTARFTSTGRLDTSFALGGESLTVFGSMYDGANAIALQADGKVVVGGTLSRLNTAAYERAFLARYTTD